MTSHCERLLEVSSRLWDKTMAKQTNGIASPTARTRLQCVNNLRHGRRQTIDKVGQLLGRGLVSKDDRLMKSLNHDTRHLSRHDSDNKKMADDKDADAFMLLYFLTAKQHKSGPYASVVGDSTGK